MMGQGFPFWHGGHSWQSGNGHQWFVGGGDKQWFGQSGCNEGGGCMGPGGNDGYCVLGQYSPLPQPGPNVAKCFSYTGAPPYPPLEQPFECPLLPPP